MTSTQREFQKPSNNVTFVAKHKEREEGCASETRSAKMSHAEPVARLRLEKCVIDPRIDMSSDPVVGVGASITVWAAATVEGLKPAEDWEDDE